MGGANQTVSGGIGGFLAFFLLACALWLLLRNMNGHLRNLRYREEAEESRLAAEQDVDVVSRPPSARPEDASAGTLRADEVADPPSNVPVGTSDGSTKRG